MGEASQALVRAMEVARVQGAVEVHWKATLRLVALQPLDLAAAVRGTHQVDPNWVLPVLFEGLPIRWLRGESGPHRGHARGGSGDVRTGPGRLQGLHP